MEDITDERDEGINCNRVKLKHIPDATAHYERGLCDVGPVQAEVFSSS